MYLFQVFMLNWLFALFSPAQGLWGARSKDSGVDKRREAPVLEGSLMDLTLESPKPLYYEQGVRKLMSFRGKPACQQIAAKILVTECQDFDKADADAEESEFVDGALYAHAVSIAICHLDVARAEVPPSCGRYGQAALSNAYQRGDYKALRGTADEVQACVEDLFKDGRSWTTLSSLLQDGRAICRAARYDIERDRVIDTNIKVTNAMQEIFDQFATDMYETSELRKAQNAEMNDMVHSWLTQLQMVKTEDASILESTKENLENLENGVKSASDVIFDIHNAFSELIESGKRAVLELEIAVSINKDIANGAQSGLEVISTVNRDLSVLLGFSRQQHIAVAQLNNNLKMLGDRIVLMDEQVTSVTNSMVNMSTDLQNLSSQHENIVNLFGNWSSAMLFMCQPSTWLVVFALLCATALLALRQWALLCSLSTICMVHLAWASGHTNTYSVVVHSTAQAISTSIDMFTLLYTSAYTEYLLVFIFSGFCFYTVCAAVILLFIPAIMKILDKYRFKRFCQSVEKRAAIIRSEREANDSFYG